jgi:hypothetical protein
MKKRSNQIGINLPFFGLVHDITSLLVSARSKEIENAIDESLAKIGEYFDVQQVALGQISSSGELLPSLRMWGDVPAIDFLSVDPPGPEMVTDFIRRGSLTWNCLEDLDELPHWREHCRQVGAVAGSMWLHRDFGSHVEGLALSASSPKVWPEDMIDSLRVVGQSLFNAYYRRQAEDETECVQRLERSIADIAANLVRARADDVDTEIDNALAQIGETTDADLCVYLRCNDSDGSMQKVNYEWSGDAINGPVFSSGSVENDYPWLATQLAKKKRTTISNVSELPLEARAELNLFERFNIQSMNWEPFEAAHGRCGYIGLGAVNRMLQWPDSLLPQLSLFGNIVADAIHRRRTDLALKQAFEFFSTRKVNRISTQVDVHNDPAIHCYAAVGFHELSRSKLYVFQNR